MSHRQPFDKYASEYTRTQDRTIYFTRLDSRLVQDVIHCLTVPSVLTHDNVPVELTIAVTRYIAQDQVPQTVLAVASYRGAEDQRALATVAELVGRRPIDYIFDKCVEFCKEIRLWANSASGYS